MSVVATLTEAAGKTAKQAWENAPTDQAWPSPRIAALRTEVMKRRGSFVQGENPYALSVALWRAMQPGRSRVQVRAHRLLEQVRLAKLEIRPGWRLAGEHLPLASDWKHRKPDPADEKAVAALAELGVVKDKAGEVSAAVTAWLENDAASRLPYATGDVSPENKAGHLNWGEGKLHDVFLGGGWSENHSVRDFAKLIRIGFRGLRKEVETRLKRAKITHPDFPRRENFWKAALAVCDAGIELGQRYSALAAELAAKATEADDRERLLAMSAACARVPAEGARTFHEALQALWFGHILTCGEDAINANSIGRLDQILWPYYHADLQAGRLTRAQAVEWLQEFNCKLYLEYDVQAVTLGGLDREGQDAVNDLSYLVLEATRDAGTIRDVAVRLHRGSPAGFVELAAEMIAHGGGIPFIFNDECFVKALADRGFALEDARDYSYIGCIELTVAGRANTRAVSGYFNAAKCLELALFDGVEPRSGQQLGPKTGSFEECKTFDDFWKAYCKQIECFAARMVYNCNRGEYRQRELGPLPLWSTLTDDCIARGRDITDGGAHYNAHEVALVGTANVADSLMALKRLVFERREIAAADLIKALKANFEGYEPLRQQLLRQAPKFGNDDPEVDGLARQVDEQFIDLMDKQRTPSGGRYFVHLFSFTQHLPYGRSVGATPDGRRAGEPLAYSVTAHQGRDERGVTALLNSIARLPHDRAAGATAAIVEMEPSFVEGPGGVKRLAALIQGAINMGVGQMQWNITTAERLRQAQQDPERYGNIPVRVSGYSQLFRLVPKDLQDHIIARTKHKE